MQTLRRIPGMVSQDDQVAKLSIRKTDRRLVQAVVSQHSLLEGQSVRDAHFRTRYDAVIIAVQRSGVEFKRALVTSFCKREMFCC